MQKRSNLLVWQPVRSSVIENKGQSSACFILVFASAIFLALSPLGLKSAIDALTLSDTQSALTSICVYFMIILLGRAAQAELVLRFSLVWRPIRERMYSDIFDQLLRRDRSIPNSLGIGQIQHTIQTGVAGIRSILSALVFGVSSTAIQCAFIILTLLILERYMFTFLFIVFGILYGVMFNIGIPNQKDAHDIASQADALVSGTGVDVIAGRDTIRIYGIQDLIRNRISSSLYRSHELWEKFSIVDYKNRNFLNLVFCIFLLICLSYTALGVLNSEFSVGDFVLLNSYLFQIMIPIERLSSSYREIIQGQAHVSRLIDTIHLEKPLAIRKRGTANLGGSPIRLEAENIWFAYSEHKQILQDISLKIEAGARVAIVGRSGSGKSTLWKVLCGLLEKQEGDVKFNNIRIEDIDDEQFPKIISVVRQDDALFNISIRENILLGRDVSNFCSALEISGLQDMTKQLPLGLSTVVGESGRNLSGGQRQRVAIARAVLGQPRILILDEATSALDALSENMIISNINVHLLESTVVLITHRLPLVMNFDTIIVMNEGRICDAGSHDNLIGSSEAYRELWNARPNGAVVTLNKCP